MSDRSDTARKRRVPELTDDDIYDAMGRLPGYLDITTDDFRDLYRLAYDHALERLAGSLRARSLMHADGPSLRPDLVLDRAAELMAAQRLKSAPVVDARGIVVGVLSESDILRQLGAGTALELVAQPASRRVGLDRLLRERLVSEVMTSPAVTVRADDDYETILRAFRSHGGRRMPVVDAGGRLIGMLARMDFLAACPIGVGD